MPSIILPLRTPRLTLRDFPPGDFDAIHSYASDRMIASQQESPRLTWELAVVLTSVNRLIGECDPTCETEIEGGSRFHLLEGRVGDGLCPR